MGTRVHRWDGKALAESEDVLVREEPLEVRVRDDAGERRLGIIMRTPGDDEDLALGFLFAEGVVHAASEVVAIGWEPAAGEGQEYNSLLVTLAAGLRVDWARVQRPLVTTSACGVCGTAVIDALRTGPRRSPPPFKVKPSTLAALPSALRNKQQVFARTGGLHGAALADAEGRILDVREDVGRHNAVDKLIGGALRRGDALSSRLLLVSGRAGYEIVAKAARAGIPFVAAVGAPSSLAVDVAREFGIGLVGFLREDRFNVYAGAERVA